MKQNSAQSTTAEATIVSDADTLDEVLASIAPLFPEPLLIVNELDQLIWMNLAMADRICRDNALEPEYAVEWLLSQIDTQNDELLQDTSQSTASSVPARLVALSDVLGRPEWLAVRVCSLPSSGATLRLVSLQDVTQIKQDTLVLTDANAILAHALHHDATTGLANRITLAEALGSPPHDGPRAVVVFDVVDKSLQIARHGPAALERVMERLSADLVEMVDDELLVARISDSRLALLQTNSPKPADLVAQVKAIGEAIHFDQRFPTGLWTVRLNAVVAIESVAPMLGEAILTEAETTIANLPTPSDETLVQIVLEDGRERARRHRDAEILSALELAIEGGQLEPFFQPVIGKSSGRVLTIEAFARWRHPENGLVPPPFFLPIAKRAGLLPSLDLAIARAAFLAALVWRKAGVGAGVSVNLSEDLLASPQTCEELIGSLAECGLDSHSVTFECAAPPAGGFTKPAVMHGIGLLRSAGLKFALDSAGAKHTDPAELYQLVPDIVKLAPTSVAVMNASPAELAATQVEDFLFSNSVRERALSHYMEVCRQIGVQITAVGVQSEAQRATLETLAVDGLQGHLFAHPMPTEQLTRWLAKCEACKDGHIFKGPQQ